MLSPALSSKLYGYALSATPDHAADLIRHALGLPETDLAAAMLPDLQTWMRNRPRQNLMAIASWLTAECAAIADESETFTTCPDPLHVVGTRD